MPLTKIQHPTLERVVYDVLSESVPDWKSAGWKVLDEPKSTDPAAGPADGVQSDGAAPAATTGPFTETQGSDSPPESPATGGPTKTTRKAV